MKIDCWTHILTPAYLRHLEELGSNAPGASAFLLANRALHDLEYRFKVMDAYDDYRQILTPIPGPHIQAQGESRGGTMADLVRRNNDEMAEAISRHPARFAGFAAATPIIDPDAAATEAVRAVRDLGALGVQLEEDASEFPLHERPLRSALRRHGGSRRRYLATSVPHARVARLPPRRRLRSCCGKSLGGYSTPQSRSPG